MGDDGVVAGADAETVVGGEVASVGGGEVGGEVGGESALAARLDWSALGAAACGAVVVVVLAGRPKVKRELRCS